MLKHTLHHRRYLISKNLIIMLVMLVVMFVAVMSWFTINKTVTASNMTVKASEVAEVEIAPVLENGLPGEFSHKYEFDGIKLVKDCSSDGRSFIVPSFSVTQGVRVGKEVNLNAPAVTATPFTPQNVEDKVEYHYYTVDYYLRSTKPNISVSRNSYLISQSEIENKSLTTNPERKSSYGNFSADALVGAMRASIQVAPATSVTNEALVPTGDAFKRQFLWVPRPDLQLVTSDTIGSWTLNTVTSGDTFKHTYFSKANGDASVNETTISKGDKIAKDSENWDVLSVSSVSNLSNVAGQTSVPTLGDNKSITNFDNVQSIQMGSKSYYVYKCRTYIWIEGSDSEARRAMNGGQFKFVFEFI